MSARKQVVLTTSAKLAGFEDCSYGLAGCFSLCLEVGTCGGADLTGGEYEISCCYALGIGSQRGGAARNFDLFHVYLLFENNDRI